LSYSHHVTCALHRALHLNRNQRVNQQRDM